MLKTALYLRVSTSTQSVENQRLELTKIAAQRGWDIVGEYVDEGISGAKGRDERPALNALLKDAARGKFCMIACWSLDRLGRSLPDLLQILQELQAVKVDLFFQQQAIDTSTPSGKLMFSVLGSLAEYERAMIRERIAAGLNRARQQGTKLGRPSKINDSLKSAVLLLRDKGLSIRKIAAELKIGVGSCYNILQAA